MSRWKPDAQGRLIAAAITLFEQRGYDETTVADIATAVGLTKRTFFRYFADKREVLFDGAQEFQQVWLDGVAAAPAGAGPMAAVSAALDRVGDLFADRHPFALLRSGIIAAHPELQERELIKLQVLAENVADALVKRGVDQRRAILAAQTGLTVFSVAFARWLQQDDPPALRRLMDESLAELRSVLTAS